MRAKILADITTNGMEQDEQMAFRVGQGYEHFHSVLYRAARSDLNERVEIEAANQLAKISLEKGDGSSGRGGTGGAEDSE